MLSYWILLSRQVLALILIHISFFKHDSISCLACSCSEVLFNQIKFGNINLNLSSILTNIFLLNFSLFLTDLVVIEFNKFVYFLSFLDSILLILNSLFAFLYVSWDHVLLSWLNFLVSCFHYSEISSYFI